MSSGQTSSEPLPPWGPVNLETIQTVCNEIAEKFKPEKIILFGSQAYGEPRWDSDVDLLIIMDFEGRSLAQSGKIRMAVDIPFPADLLIRRPDEAMQSYEEYDPFIRAAIDDGKVMYERNDEKVA